MFKVSQILVVSCVSGSTCIKVPHPKNGTATQFGIFLLLRCNSGYFFNPNPPGLPGHFENPSYRCLNNKWVSQKDFKSILIKPPDCMGKNELFAVYSSFFSSPFRKNGTKIYIG